MPDEKPTTIAAAFAEMKDSDLEAAAAADEAEEEALSEGAAPSEDDGEPGGREAEAAGDDDNEAEEEQGDEGHDPPNALDLTPETLAAIKASPELRAVYKSLMRGYTKKSTDNARALDLVRA